MLIALKKEYRYDAWHRGILHAVDVTRHSGLDVQEWIAVESDIMDDAEGNLHRHVREFAFRWEAISYLGEGEDNTERKMIWTTLELTTRVSHNVKSDSKNTSAWCRWWCQQVPRWSFCFVDLEILFMDDIWTWRRYCGKQRVWRDTRRKLSCQLIDAEWVLSSRIRAPSQKTIRS